MWLCVVLFVFSAHITLFFISFYCVAGATHKTQLLAENVSIRSGKRAHMMLAFICDCWWGHFSCCCALWGHNCGLSGEDAGRTSICMFYLPVRHTFHINGLYSNERSPFVVLCSSSYIIHANVEKCIFLPVFFLHQSSVSVMRLMNQSLHHSQPHYYQISTKASIILYNEVIYIPIHQMPMYIRISLDNIQNTISKNA